jgi:hypothetical protein
MICSMVLACLIYRHLQAPCAISVAVKFCNDSPCNRSRPDSVDAFLKSIPPLRQLRIAQSKFANGAQIESFDWTVLTAHAPKLRCLELDHFERWSEIFVDTTRNLPDFLAFCKSASNLQQLSIVGPKIERPPGNSLMGFLL